MGIAQPFIHRLTFEADRCTDATGAIWTLTREGNAFYFIKGRIWTSGGLLFREGKSGIVMRFRREEEEEEEEEEQDGLQVLESMVCEGQ